MSDIESFADRLRRARESKGISASGLAKLVAVSPTAVWNWETNGIHPRADTLQQIAKVLGVSREFLLTGDHPGSSDPMPFEAALPKNLTIAQAKRALAASLDVPESAIEIVIRS